MKNNNEKPSNRKGLKKIKKFVKEVKLSERDKMLQKKYDELKNKSN